MLCGAHQLEHQRLQVLCQRFDAVNALRRARAVAVAAAVVRVHAEAATRQAARGRVASAGWVLACERVVAWRCCAPARQPGQHARRVTQAVQQNERARAAGAPAQVAQPQARLRARGERLRVRVALGCWRRHGRALTLTKRGALCPSVCVRKNSSAALRAAANSCCGTGGSVGSTCDTRRQKRAERQKSLRLRRARGGTRSAACMVRTRGTNLGADRGADGACRVRVCRQLLVPAQLRERVWAAPRRAPPPTAVAEDALEAGVAHHVPRDGTRAARRSSAPTVTKA
jgi:hypothetical protein